MKLYFETNNYKLYNGNMLELNNVIADNSIDAVVTDPPYELGFMGKSWDASGIAFQKETWRKCFNALKPGGYLLAFGGSRTFHRIACAIEDAGFEIRDTIIWLYGQGFPKSMSISKAIEAKETYGIANTVHKKKIEMACEGDTFVIKQTNNGAMGEVKEFERKIYNPTSNLAKQWDGWGTALKPSFEPIIVARKPCEGSCVDNVLKWGVGGINIDECRVGNETHKVNINDFSNQHGNKFGNGEPIAKLGEKEITGRFPANTILTYDDSDYDEVCGEMPNDNGVSASRYFYCAKASKRDRDEGLDGFEEKYKLKDNVPDEIIKEIEEILCQ